MPDLDRLHGLSDSLRGLAPSWNGSATEQFSGTNRAPVVNLKREVDQTSVKSPSMASRKSAGIQDSSCSITKRTTLARSSSGRARICSITSTALILSILSRIGRSCQASYASSFPQTPLLEAQWEVGKVKSARNASKKEPQTATEQNSQSPLDHFVMVRIHARQLVNNKELTAAILQSVFAEGPPSTPAHLTVSLGLLTASSSNHVKV
jgi:hypothetical protein